MADVYIVNLKDNRENHDKNDDIKFETCMRNKIISIGWGSEESREGPSFKASVNNLPVCKWAILCGQRILKIKTKSTF